MILPSLLLLLLLCVTICYTAGVNLQCSNITGTVGSALTLTCNVSSNVSSRCDQYKWKKNETELENCRNCSLISNLTSHCVKNDTNNHISCVSDRKCDTVCNVTFNHTIKNASMEHSGNYTFWVQLNTGISKRLFNVTVSEGLLVSAPNPVSDEADQKVSKAAGIIVAAVALGLIFVSAFLWRRRRQATGYHNPPGAETCSLLQILCSNDHFTSDRSGQSGQSDQSDQSDRQC